MNRNKCFTALGILAACAGLALTGCSVGPQYHSPEFAVPDSFGSEWELSATQPTTRPAIASSRPDPELAHWWTSLDDPMLDALVSEAIRSNLDLKIAVARLQEARAAEAAVTGGGMPGLGQSGGLGFSGAAGRTTGNNATKGRIAPALNAASDTSGVREITELVGFDAGWELDLFGRYGHVVQSVEADTQAVGEARRQVLITVIADVVRTYVDVRSDQFRVGIAEQNIATQKRTLDLVRVRLRRGLTNDLDVALAERQYAAALTRVAPLKAATAAAQRRLAVLLGRMPEDLRKQLATPAALPSLPPGVSTGLPVDLLRRRPDIRQAERQLASSTARVGVATADLFPRVLMTGGVGWQQQDLGRAPALGKFVYSAGPSLYWPLLDFGRLDAAIEAQDFHTQQLLLTYRKLVIGAVQEVDDALDNYAAEQDRLKELGEAVAASRRAATMAAGRYNTGLTDFLNVLDAQRQLFELEDQYALAEEALIWQFVSLYKSLGGGWQGFEAPAAPRLPQPALVAVMKTLSEPHPAVSGPSATPDRLQLPPAPKRAEPIPDSKINPLGTVPSTLH